MKTTARVLLMSRLSDVQKILKSENTHEINDHVINFIKYIVAKFPNTDFEIDADEEYQEYLKLLPEH